MRCFRRKACTEVINFSSHFSDVAGSRANANLLVETVGVERNISLDSRFSNSDARTVPAQIREQHNTTFLETTLLKLFGLIFNV